MLISSVYGGLCSFLLWKHLNVFSTLKDDLVARSLLYCPSSNSMQENNAHSYSTQHWSGSLLPYKFPPSLLLFNMYLVMKDQVGDVFSFLTFWLFVPTSKHIDHEAFYKDWKIVKGLKHHSKLTELFSNQYLIRPLEEQKFQSLVKQSLVLALWLIFPIVWWDWSQIINTTYKLLGLFLVKSLATIPDVFSTLAS